MAHVCLGHAGEPSEAEQLGEGLTFVVCGEGEDEDAARMFLFFEGVGLWVGVGGGVWRGEGMRRGGARGGGGGRFMEGIGRVCEEEEEGGGGSIHTPSLTR